MNQPCTSHTSSAEDTAVKAGFGSRASLLIGSIAMAAVAPIAAAATEAASAVDPRQHRHVIETTVMSIVLITCFGMGGGTVSMLKGDVGRAVASLRRADRLDPLDPRVAADPPIRRRISRGR